jgi:hypothetical protein
MKLETDIKILFDNNEEQTYTLVAVGRNEKDQQVFVMTEKAIFQEMLALEKEELDEEEINQLLIEKFPDFKPLIVPVNVIDDNILGEIPEENLVIVDLRNVSPKGYVNKD